MDVSEMLHEMCQQTLADVDVRAVCKSRGFSARGLASRTLFERSFLSETGVRSAMDSLTKSEVLMLHLPNSLDAPVDVEFFTRVYPVNNDQWARHRTYTQRFNGVFGKVKQNLVRKGLLLMIETRKRSKSVSKLERWLFRFPPRFAEFLPPPFESTTGSSQAGDLRSDVLGRKLRKVVGGEPVDRESRDKRYTLTCANGRLRMGGVRFTADRLREWQRECWVTDLPVAEAKPGAERAPSGTSLVDAVIYLLGTLNESEWLGVERLSRPFEVFCGTPSNGAEICEAGWKWGCLVKQEIDGQTCYRLPGPGADAAAPEEYLDDGGSKGWTVDLDAVPYRDLEVLARIAELSPVRPGIAKLVVVPSLIGLGAAPADLLNEPLLEWLLERSAPFAEAIETVRQRRGKHLVHENLMIARVRDLSLKVEIQRSCKGGVVLLPNDYIAFPRASTKAVEKVVTKAGHAIKKRRRHG